MVKCPTCGSEVRVISFGSAFIAVCCGKIIYRGYRPPEAHTYPAGHDDTPKMVIFLDEKRSRG
jgi:hypothetical protein